jgi:hypothetical protein
VLDGFEHTQGEGRRAATLDKPDQLVDVVPLVPRDASGELEWEASLDELRSAPPHNCLQILAPHWHLRASAS